MEQPTLSEWGTTEEDIFTDGLDFDENQNLELDVDAIFTLPEDNYPVAIVKDNLKDDNLIF